MTSEQPETESSTDGAKPEDKAREPLTRNEIVGTELEVDRRVTLIQLMLDQMTVEGERFWQRNNVFITIVTGLFGLYAIKFDDFFGAAHIVYGVVGLVIAIGWRHTIIASNYYAERWRVDAREYIKTQSDLVDVLRCAAGNPRVVEPKGPKSSAVMIRFAVLSAWMWGAAILWGAAQMLFVPWPTNDAAESAVCLRVEDGRAVEQIPCERTQRRAFFEIDWSRGFSPVRDPEGEGKAKQ